MARKPRLHIDGCPQHLIQRGNNRSVCFFSVADYAFYLHTLKEAALVADVKIHAFVLMTNHVHLLASGASKDSIPHFMQALGRRFVRYINLTYERTGTLWEGRYKSSLVSSTEYFLAVSRYIELNPVRARMVAQPGEYPWSSFRHNGMGIDIGLVTEHQEYKRLAATKAGRVQAYRQLFAGPLSTELVDEIRSHANKGWVLGGDQFKQQLTRKAGAVVKNYAWGGDRKSSSFAKSRCQSIK